jgi:drug/metabolite transporter superfamily protein YnfA
LRGAKEVAAITLSHSYGNDLPGASQPVHLGRVYGAFGGLFIVLSLLWGWMLDGDVPDFFDIVGGAVSLLGLAIIMYWPR